MAIYLLGKGKTGNNWQVLHETSSYEDMADQLDLHIDKECVEYAIVNGKYFDNSTQTITNPEQAFAEVPDFVEDAFVETFFGGR